MWVTSWVTKTYVKYGENKTDSKLKSLNHTFQTDMKMHFRSIIFLILKSDCCYNLKKKYWG